MNDNIQQNEEIINRYLFGLMSPDEEATFEENIKSNKQLREQAESIAHIVKAMDSVGKKQDKTIVEGMKQTSKKLRFPVKWISIAASFALVLTVGYNIYDYNRIGSLGAEYAMAFPVSEIIRGEEDEDVAQTLTELFDNVTNGENLECTISRLSKLWTLSQSDTYNEYTTYAPYIGWNLAIAYLRNHNKKEAKQILKQSQTMNLEGTAIEKTTAELLKKI